MKSKNIRILMLVMICLKSTNIWASNYESPAEAFVVGALSWLLFITIVFVARWLYRQFKDNKSLTIDNYKS